MDSERKLRDIIDLCLEYKLETLRTVSRHVTVKCEVVLWIS